MDRRAFIAGSPRPPRRAARRRGATGEGSRIGLLRAGRLRIPSLEGFRQGLRELGYVEGQNVVIEYRWAEGKLERLAGLAAGAGPTRGRRHRDRRGAGDAAAMSATSTIPIVMGAAGSPVHGPRRQPRPTGRQRHGADRRHAELSAKRLSCSRRPSRTSRAWPSWGTRPTRTMSRLEGVPARAQSLRIQLQAVEVRNPNEFEGAFAAMARGRAGAFIHGRASCSSLTDAGSWSSRRRAGSRRWATTELRRRRRLHDVWAELPSDVPAGRHYVDKILKGAKPADLPVEQPTKSSS